jgi:hypothetical protein
VTTTQTRQARSHARLTGGQIAMIIIGAIATLIGLGLLLSATVIAVAGHNRSDGFITSGTAPLSTDSYAVAVPGVGIDVRGPDQAYARRLLGTVRIRATSADPAVPVFVGIGRTADVDGYLDGVGHADITEIKARPVSVDYVNHAGSAPRSAPAQQTFWDSSDSGTGTRTLNWNVAAGDWTVVVMNADGSARVRADVDLGGTLPVLRTATIVLFVAGGLILAAGLLLMLLPVVTRRREPSWTGPGAGGPVGPDGSVIRDGSAVPGNGHSGVA